MKTETTLSRKLDRKIRQALGDAILSVLSMLWMAKWLGKKATLSILEKVIRYDLNAPDSTNLDHIKVLRKKPRKWAHNVSYQPEKAYSYSEATKRSKDWAFVFGEALVFVLIVVPAVVVKIQTAIQTAIRQQSEAPDVLYWIRFISVASVVVLLCLTIYEGFRCWTYRMCKASKFLAGEWEKARQDFILLGFVAKATDELMSDNEAVKCFLSEDTHQNRSATEQHLKRLYLEFLVDVAVPHAKAELSRKIQPVEDNEAKENFDLAISLVPYVGISEDPRKVRETAYRAGRERAIKELEADETQTIDLPLPSRPAPPPTRSVRLN